ncbi:MAG: GNAT family N-acetyltransferase [Myxococcales bacterium]|nr:GNAT family N-acetyltransferase [Myxococcales bacterium]
MQGRLADVAALRIAVFRAYPYLYEGDDAYERGYLASYVASPGSVIVGAFDGDRLVGASTGVPLEHEPDWAQAPFRTAGEVAAELFYLGESVLHPEYRGTGVGVRFFEEREKQARALGRQRAAFCAVERPHDHPARPVTYVPLDGFWGRRGYERTGLTTRLSWREVGDVAETEKTMRFWWKRLY